MSIMVHRDGVALSALVLVTAVCAFFIITKPEAGPEETPPVREAGPKAVSADVLAAGGSYAIQAGEGGVLLGAGSRVGGDLYSIGSVRASADVSVDGLIIVSGTGSGIFGSSRWDRVRMAGGLAERIENADASAFLHCKEGVGNARACQRLPAATSESPESFSEETISEWKRAAASLVERGDRKIGYEGAVIGPLKIDGDLVIDDGADVLLAGPIWVTGDVFVGGGSVIRPVESDMLSAILADGQIRMFGGSRMDSAGGRIMLVSESGSQDAVVINGGASDASVLAVRGGVHISGGASVLAVEAGEVFISESAVVGAILGVDG